MKTSRRVSPMIQRRKPLKSFATLEKVDWAGVMKLHRSAPPRKRRSQPRCGPFRDPDYLKWLRLGYCIICGFHGCDPAHGPVNGMGSKGPDNEAIHLCRRHHREVHKLLIPAFEKKYGFKWLEVARDSYATFRRQRKHTIDAAMKRMLTC